MQTSKTSTTDTIVICHLGKCTVHTMQRLLPHTMSMFPHSISEVPSKQEQSLTKHFRTAHLSKLCIHKKRLFPRKRKYVKSTKNTNP